MTKAELIRHMLDKLSDAYLIDGDIPSPEVRASALITLIDEAVDTLKEELTDVYNEDARRSQRTESIADSNRVRGLLSRCDGSGC